MTNLFLVATIATNMNVTRIDCVGTTNTHLYSVLYATDLNLPLPVTNWTQNWIFVGAENQTNTFYDYTNSTNRFYIVQDLGLRF